MIAKRLVVAAVAQIESDEVNVAFKMLDANVTKALDQLDSIRRTPQKFICINDNIDHTLPESAEVVDAIQSFFEAFFPLPSQFELPAGYRNRYLHLEELRTHQDRQAWLVMWARLTLVALLVGLVYAMFGYKMVQWRRSFLLRYRQRNLADRPQGVAAEARKNE